MEIKINKEIRRYQENIFFGLSTRQFACSLLALGLAVGVYFLLKGPLGEETVSWLCILAAVPVAAMGFFQYNSLTLEQFLLAWFKSEFLYAGPRKFVAQNYYFVLLQQIESDKAKLKKGKAPAKQAAPAAPATPSKAVPPSAAKKPPSTRKQTYKQQKKELPAHEKNTGKRPVLPGPAGVQRAGVRGKRGQ